MQPAWIVNCSLYVQLFTKNCYPAQNFQLFSQIKFIHTENPYNSFLQNFLKIPSYLMGVIIYQRKFIKQVLILLAILLWQISDLSVSWPSSILFGRIGASSFVHKALIRPSSCSGCTVPIWTDSKLTKLNDQIKCLPESKTKECMIFKLKIP